MKFNYLILALLNNNKINNNINNLLCKNCKFFQPSSSTDFDSTLGKCKNFGKQNLIDGKTNYDYADLCRNDDNKCSKSGIYYEKEENLNLKKFKHSLRCIFSYNTFFISFYILFYTLIIYDFAYYLYK
jgi:hypothetical protein